MLSTQLLLFSHVHGRLLFRGGARHHRCIASASRPLVQRVYEAASAGDLDETMRLMDALSAEDVALLPPAAPRPGRTPPVGYHHVYKDEALSMGIFVIPAGAGIPLHDHPGMTVLSKLLFGSIRVTSYDMPVDMQAASKPAFSLFGSPQPRASRMLTVDSPSHATVSAPCATLRLDPNEGNIHQFDALQDTAIFDVLLPPYDDREGRSCHYYAVEGSELVEVGWPPNLAVVSREYLGPRVSCGGGGR